MYDESIVVVNAREIPSPASSESESPAREMAGNKFNPPARHLAAATGGTFDSDSDSQSDPERFVNDNKPVADGRAALKSMPSKSVPEMKREVSKEEKRRSGEKSKQIDSSDNSDSDSVGYEGGGAGALHVGAAGGSTRGRGGGVVVPASGAYDPKKFADLKVPPELDNLFQHILRYTPQKIDIDFKLQPFVPEYIPAVGDIDAFIKVTTPACRHNGKPIDNALLEKVEHFGLTVLDEPAAEQSDAALLHLQLRAISKTNTAQSTVVTKKIENAEKNSKAIERWIKDVSELHLSKPAPTVAYTVKMPDLDTLMEEWPDTMEETLNNVGFPASSIDCSLIEYVDLICTLFDIPIVEDSLNARIQALHMFFTLYMAVKNSQLYADRQKEVEAE